MSEMQDNGDWEVISLPQPTTDAKNEGIAFVGSRSSLRRKKTETMMNVSRTLSLPAFSQPRLPGSVDELFTLRAKQEPETRKRQDSAPSLNVTKEIHMTSPSSINSLNPSTRKTPLEAAASFNVTSSGNNEGLSPADVALLKNRSPSGRLTPLSSVASKQWRALKSFTNEVMSLSVSDVVSESSDMLAEALSMGSRKMSVSGSPRGTGVFNETHSENEEDVLGGRGISARAGGGMSQGKSRRLVGGDCEVFVVETEGTVF